MTTDTTLELARQQLAHTSPHYGWGLRRQQSQDGSWLDGQLERGRRCNEISQQYKTRSEGDAAAGRELGIRSRQVRTYRKFWEQRSLLRVMWQQLPTDQRPTSMEAAMQLLSK